VAQTRWVAEHGLGEKGSPRYVSGRVSLTFLWNGDTWQLRGWLGSRGPHHAVEGSQRSDDVQAIREQILRVFEAYRQKDLAMLRRTHTADWRGFTLASPLVGRGIDAYIQAAEGAIGSTQFEEYQILDLAPVFYGDIAIVPYVARIAGKNRQGRTEAYRLRVLDVYLKEPMGWNQVATNTSLHPEELIGG
jgi:ketosteroid isomerase-like protein